MAKLRIFTVLALLFGVLGTAMPRRWVWKVWHLDLTVHGQVLA